jgi:energy-coupling factor transporter transmembrane protein EcfT|tara:strand:+ start:117 stop:392 length:276 start_codon:yes stop_codon:yes gene_type:complete
MIYPRKINLFEKGLLIIGILIIISGYLFVYGFVAKEGLSWNALQTTFLWLLLIVMIILAAVNENMKEELKVVINNQVKEMKLLREDLKRQH